MRQLRSCGARDQSGMAMSQYREGVHVQGSVPLVDDDLPSHQRGQWPTVRKRPIASRYIERTNHANNTLPNSFYPCLQSDYLWANAISKAYTGYEDVRELTRLDLETPGCSSSTSSLELPSLGSDVWLTTLEGTTKVLDGLPDVPLAPQQNSVGTGRSSESESVEGNGLTTSGGDSLSGSVGES